MEQQEQNIMNIVKSSFSGCSKLTSDEFYRIFKAYDLDGNGYIQAGELDNFLKDIQTADKGAQNLQQLKDEVLDKYDANYDGKIEMSELAQMLPMEENFLLAFRLEGRICSVEFMKIFKKYDTDKSGYIEKNEFKVFLMDLLTLQGRNINPQRIDDYAMAMIELFDKNKDGRLELEELARILPIEENFLDKFPIRKTLTREQFEAIFNHYDKDGNGDIEGDELDGLIMDLLQHQNKVDVTKQNVDSFKRNILSFVDVNKDGKIQKDELGVVFSHQ